MENSGSTPGKLKWLITLFLLLLGISVSAYLLYHYLQLTGNQENARHDVCSAVFGKGCDAALQSPVSRQLGLPLAAWSVLYYLSIVLLLAIPVLFGPSFKKNANLFLFMLTAAGVAVALTLLTLMLFKPALFCPLCTLLHAVNIGLFFFLNRATAFRAGRVIPEIRKNLHTLFSGGMKKPETRWKIFGFISAAIILASCYFGLVILTTAPSDDDSAMIDSGPILEEFYSQKIRYIPVLNDDPVLGSAGSPVSIVVFTDFYCPSCKRFYKELERLINSGKGNFRVVFKNFPLSTDCNRFIDKNLHPGACEAALAGTAAFRQGKFWAFHDSVFSAEPGKYSDFLHLMARKSGLDSAAFDQFRAGEQAAAKIRNDITLAASLGIDATPSVFLNGRLVTDMRPGILQFLVNRELERISRKDSTSNTH